MPITSNLVVSPGAAPSPGRAAAPVAPAPAPQELAIPSPPAADTSRAPALSERSALQTTSHATFPPPAASKAIAPPPATTPSAEQQQWSDAVPKVLALRPAARLKPIVHAAVSEILANLSHGVGQAEAELTAEALFVPLRAFQQRGIDTALAVDSLDSAGLLQRTSQSAKTSRQSIAGETVVGVLVKGSHITGFPAPSEPPA
jgi:hypothetical protein